MGRTFDLTREQRNGLVAWTWILACIAFLCCVMSCAGLGAWLSAPEGSAPPGASAQSVTFALPGGGSLTLPAAPAGQPAEFYVHGLGLVRIDPTAQQPAGAPAQAGGTSGAAAPGSGSGAGATSPPAPTSPAAPAVGPGPTNADAVGQAAGGVVSLVTGNAMLGVLAAGLLSQLLGRRKTTPTTTVA